MYIVYQKDLLLLQRDSLTNPDYEEILLNINPSTVLYIDPSGSFAGLSQSLVGITASVCESSSWANNILGLNVFGDVSDAINSHFAESSSYNVSSSYCLTASFALNGGNGAGGSTWDTIGSTWDNL